MSTSPAASLPAAEGTDTSCVHMDPDTNTCVPPAPGVKAFALGRGPREVGRRTRALL